MSEQIVRTERHMQGNKAVQKTTYSDGTAEGQLALMGIGGAVLILGSPFAVILWLMDWTVFIIRAAGGHPLVGIVLAAILAAGIIFLFLQFRPFRYVYLVINALVIAKLVYNFGQNFDWNLNFTAVFAAILFLGALIGGFIGERLLENQGLSGIIDEIRNL